eukprot:4942874-Pyramimonas_sp.AAC.1
MGENFELHWTRAHTSRAAAEREGTPAHWHIGNREADKRAKEGAQLHRGFAQVEELTTRMSSATVAASRLLRHPRR